MFIVDFLITFFGKFIFPPNFFIIDVPLSEAEVMDYLGNAAEI